MLTKTTKTKLQKESERKQKLQKLISLKIKKKVKLGEQWKQVRGSTILAWIESTHKNLQEIVGLAQTEVLSLSLSLSLSLVD